MSSSASPLGANQSWFLGTGRRKESIARVFLRAGSGKFTVNGRTVEQYFPNHAWKHDAIEPLKFTNLGDQVDVVCTANGGGVGGQAGAVRMGLSRAISRYNPELRPSLRTNGFLTRDSRMKERKKYGQKGARKRFQFTKR
ncbi:MAG TPA: 30S ribosomal protein S9 [Candidatus Acidoferrum sp.]